MNSLKLNYRQLPSKATYFIRQENSVTENEKILFQNVQYREIVMEIARVTFSGAATINIKFGEIEPDAEKNLTPFSLKRYIDQTNQLLKEIILNIDSSNHIESVENQQEIVSAWNEMKNHIFDNNSFLSEEEKNLFIEETGKICSSSDELIKLLEDYDYLKFFLADFYGIYLDLGKEMKMGKQTYNSLALSKFSVPLNISIYLESISEERNECEISVYGIMDAKTLDYDLLRVFTLDELDIDTLTSYNYFVDLMYIVDISTGLIKNMDIEVTETFNDTLSYKFDQFVSNKI